MSGATHVRRRSSIAVGAVAICLFSATPAAADPASLGALIVAGINAIAGAGTLSATATVVGTLTVAQAFGLAATVGLLALASLGPKGVSASSANAKETFKSDAMAETIVIGRARVGGLQAYGNTAGLDRYRLICHAKGELTAIESHWLGGREVIVEEDGAVSSPPWAILGTSWAHVWNKAGTDDEVSWDQLMTAFPETWTADHRCRGIAQSLVKFISPGVTEPKFLKLYSSGVPAYETVRRSRVCYDPRTGGYAWTDNGIIQTLAVALMAPEVTLDDFDLADLAIECDKADALVATLTGFEKRCRAWGVLSSETKRGDALKQMLESTGCEMVWIGEKQSIRLIEDARPSEVTVSPRAIVDYSAAGPEAVERPNICVIRYYSPERNFSVSEIDMTGIGWARIDEEIERFGPKELAVELPFCPSASQAQRIARRLFAEARSETWPVTTNLAGLAAWGCSVISVPIADLDETIHGIVRRIEIDDAGATVSLSLTAVPILADWDPATMEAAAPEQIPEIPVASALPTPDAPSAAVEIVYPDSSRELRVVYDTTGEIDAAEATYRSYDGELPTTWRSMIEHGSGGLLGGGFGLEWASDTLADSLIGVTIDARVRIFAGDDGSNWSSVYSAEVVEGNGPIAAPIVTATNAGGTATVSVLAPGDINVSRLTISGPGAPGTVAAAPGGLTTFDTVLTGPGPWIWTATAATSSGLTTSSIASATLT